MITYVNNSNAVDYSELFERATAELVAADGLDGGNGSIIKKDDATGEYDTITTIEQYFYYLPALLKIENSKAFRDDYEGIHSKGRRYTMLPLTEEPFKIDANKRTIEIPSEFRDGVSVKGDQLAEVLYFKIDRFFDAMDLDTADVYIQWTRPDGKSGVSVPWVIDIESEQNTMIIGWALSSTITELAGQLKFALRFYKWADPDEKTTLSYSWSTIAQTVTIKTSLDFNLSNGEYIPEIDTYKEIFERISASESKVVGNEEASMPEFILNLGQNEGTIADENYEGFYYVDLVDDQSYGFMVQAKSNDTGVISYTWQEANKVELGADGDTENTVESYFVLTEDTAVQPNKAYYEKTTASDGREVYKLFKLSLLTEDDTPASKGLYEKFSKCTVTKIGTYSAIVTNSKVGTNKTSKQSDICIVPPPSEPTITKNVDEEYIFDADTTSLDITLGIDNTEANKTKSGKLTYEWYMVNEADKNGILLFPESPIGAASESATLTLTKNIDEPKSVEGYYKAVITNAKNGETAQIESDVCRVSYAAEAPVLVVLSDADAKVNFGTAATVSLNADWVNKWNISDEITYQWYYTDDENIDVEDQPMEGATEASYVAPNKGKYFCKVTNHKGQTTASTNSIVFYFA